MASHHIAFVPIKLTPRKPSGDQFSHVLITVQIEQQPGFYTGKLVTGTQQLGSGHRSPGRVPTRRIQIYMYGFIVSKPYVYTGLAQPTRYAI